MLLIQVKREQSILNQREKKGGIVGLFNKKTTLTSDYDIVSSIIHSLVRGLLSIIQQELISETDSDLYWALIQSASDRYLTTTEEREAIRSMVFNLIDDAIELKVKNRSTDQKILDAYKSRMEISHIYALYSDLLDKTQLNAKLIQGSLNELIVDVAKGMPKNIYIKTGERSFPLFTHYLSEGAAQAHLDSDDINIISLSTMLTIAFSLSFETTFDLVRRESEAITEKRLNKIKSIFSYIIVIWGFRAAIIDIELRKPLDSTTE
jgi:hypothetical protein